MLTRTSFPATAAQAQLAGFTAVGAQPVLAQRPPEAQPGKDGPWRIHVKVKNGDLVLFTDSTVVFENGADELDNLWEVAEFLNGSKGKVGPLTDPLHKAFYAKPDKALVTADPPMETGQPMFFIRITN